MYGMGTAAGGCTGARRPAGLKLTRPSARRQPGAAAVTGRSGADAGAGAVSFRAPSVRFLQGRRDISMLASMSLLPLLLATSAPSGITLLWCSDPVRPNETLMVQYASDTVPLVEPFIRLQPVRGSGQQALSLAPSQVTNQTVAFELPADIGVDAYEVTLSAAGATSNTIVANAPAVWWVQGDGGSMATAGGWLRAFGHGLALPQLDDSDGSAARTRPHLALQALSQRLAAATQRNDWAEAAELAQQAAALASKQKSATTAAALATTLTLTPQLAASDLVDATAPIVITASNATEYAAWFAVPETVPPGRYQVAISNGAASGALASYYDHLQPNVTTVEIKSPEANAWGSKVVHVTEHGCVASLTNYSDQIDCTDAFLSAIEVRNAPLFPLFPPSSHFPCGKQRLAKSPGQTY